MDGLNDLPPRPGSRPRTRRELPHAQLDQQPDDPAMRTELVHRAFALPGVVEEPSRISVPGARALALRPDIVGGHPDAFIVDREFAHLHPPPDQSLHLTLPKVLAETAVEAGWAEWHPLTAAGELPGTVVLIYAPRDHRELAVVWRILQTSHQFATYRP